MAPASRKSRPGLVSLKVRPAKLRVALGLPSEDSKEATPAVEVTPKDEDNKSLTAARKESPTRSATVPTGGTNGELPSDSNPGTPAASGTPAPGAGAAETNGTNGKRRGGNKRGAGAANLDPKPRGKPGPKKRPRLEDGTIDPTSTARGGGHKLGPKANQGAINAGLRALDRSGTPCRKWAKGSFRVKSFTGVVWEVNRWTAPVRRVVGPEDSSKDGESAGASPPSSNNNGSGSNKGGDAAQGKSDANSPNPAAAAAAAAGTTTNGTVVNGGDSQQQEDVEMAEGSVARSAPAASTTPNTPTPAPAAAAEVSAT